MNARLLHIGSALLLLCAGAFAVSESDFRAGSFTRGGTTVMFRLFVPYSAPTPGRLYPIVLALHGVGERGSDNSAQLINHTIDWADETRQAANPSFVLVPQCPSDEYWVGDQWGVWASGVYTQTPTIAPALGTVIALLDSLVSALPVDLNRQYVTGLSMGGMGTWDLMVRFPARWAAAVPVCGAVDTAAVPNLRDLPLWAYHGSADDIVPPLGTRAAMRQLTRAGSTIVYPRCGELVPSCTPLSASALAATIRTARQLYTEIAGGGHFAWDDAYTDEAMFTWIYLQSKGSVVVGAQSGGLGKATAAVRRHGNRGGSVDLQGRLARTGFTRMQHLRMWPTYAR